MSNIYNNDNLEKSKNVSANSYIFFGIYFIYILTQLISTLNKSWNIPNIVNYVIIGALIFLIILNKYNTKIVLLNIAMLGIVTIVSIQTTNAVNFILTYLLILCAPFVDFRKIVSLHTITLGVFMTGAYFLYSLGSLSELSYVTHLRDENVRYSMGYLYPTFMPNFYFHLVLMYIYLKKKLNIIEVILILVINNLIYIFTDTKSAYYLTIATVVLCYIYMKFNIYSVINGKLVKFIYFVTTVFFIIVPTWLSYIYNPNVNWHYELNKILTSRLSLGSTAIEKYGLSLFGDEIEWIVLEKAWLWREYFYVDSSSLNMYLTYGMVFSLIIYILFYKVTSRKIMNNSNPVFFVVLIVLLIHSAFDPQFFEIRYNPFILLVGTLLNPRKDTE